MKKNGDGFVGTGMGAMECTTENISLASRCIELLTCSSFVCKADDDEVGKNVCTDDENQTR